MRGRASYLEIVLAGVFGGLVIVALPYIVISHVARSGDPSIASQLLSARYGATILLTLPFVQGCVSGIVAARSAMGFGRYVAVAFLVLAVDGLLAIGVLREGVICLLIGAPLFVLVIGLGELAGYGIRRTFDRVILRTSLVPLVALAVSYDALSGDPKFSNVVRDEVTIDAPASYVWRYIVQYPENDSPPEYWLWRIGLPAPIQSTAAGESVGTARQCRFTDGIVFEEEITEIVPERLLAFKVTKQPDHPEIVGHFSLDAGELALTANPDGTTTVVATSWYRLFVWPGWYFDWWAAGIARNIHFRVLGHVKALAEADRRAGVADLN